MSKLRTSQILPEPLAACSTRWIIFSFLLLIYYICIYLTYETHKADKPYEHKGDEHNNVYVTTYTLLYEATILKYNPCETTKDN